MSLTNKIRGWFGGAQSPVDVLETSSTTDGDCARPENSEHDNRPYGPALVRVGPSGDVEVFTVMSTKYPRREDGEEMHEAWIRVFEDPDTPTVGSLCRHDREDEPTTAALKAGEEALTTLGELRERIERDQCGTESLLKGERRARQKFTDEQVRTAREVYARGGATSLELATLLRTDESVVGRWTRGAARASAGGPFTDGKRWGSGTAIDPLHRHRRDDGSSAKLTPGGVARARRKVREGVTVAALAREFGVSENTLHQAVRGKTWKHVAEPPVPAARKRRKAGAK